MSNIKNRKPLDEHDIVIHVPKGTAGHVHIEESDAGDLPSEITIQVSKKRRAGMVPVLGVIVK
jgi:hypothetical protein